MTCLYSSFLLQISLLLLFLFINPSSTNPIEKATTNDIIQDVCSQTISPPFCLKVLNSNPQITKTIDARGLAKISIDLAHASAKENYAIIEGLIKQENNPVLKERYAFCYKNYDEATRELGDTTRLLESGDYKGVHDQALSAMDGAEDCQDQFDVPPNDNSQLQGKFENFVNLCSIILAVNDLLF